MEYNNKQMDQEENFYNSYFWNYSSVELDIALDLTLVLLI